MTIEMIMVNTRQREIFEWLVDIEQFFETPFDINYFM